MYMEYTTIPEYQLQEYTNKFKETPGIKPSWIKIKEKCRNDATLFAYHFLGIKLFAYQDQVINNNSKRIIVCSSRQIGKTTAVAVKTLHYAMFNKNKEILVFSRNHNQAKKFIRLLKSMIFSGQVYMNHISSSESCPFKLDEDPAYAFPEDLDDKKPNNTEEFSLTNGTTIRSLPATDSSRGYTANLVIVDEAAFVEDDVFEMVIEPTVRYTDGTIILLSTPNGQKGFFFKTFDPEDKRINEEQDELTYVRYWWNWELCPAEAIRKITEKKRKELDPITFGQEYEAKFTTSGDSFFQYRKVKEAILNGYSMVLQDLEHPSICGIDFGVSKSRTVVTISFFNKETNNITMSYQKEFLPGYNNSNLIPFLEQLETRFNITQYVVDDCPQGQDVTNSLEKQGKNVYRFYFGKEKVAAYFRFRAALNQRDDDPGPRIRYPEEQQLIGQMLELQISDNKRGSFFIEKPAGGLDDRIDSFVLSTYPFLKVEKKEEFSSYLV